MKKTAFLVLAILLALPAAAERVQVDEVRPAAPDGEVSVELISGTLEIVGWNRDEVHVTGTIDDDYETLEVEAEHGSVQIEVDVAEGRHRSIEGAELKIRVPAGSDLEVEAISAEVSVEDVNGAVEIEAISGNVDVRGSTEEIQIECVSGTVTVKTAGDLRRAGIETVSGNIELAGALGRGARLNLESVNGSIVLRLPSNTSAEFEVSTFNGSIHNDFGPRAEKASKYLPAQELSFTLGSGDARVSIEAFNGTVRLVED